MEDDAQANGVAITDGMIESMRATRPWTMLLAVLGFVMNTLMALFGAGLIFLAGRFHHQQRIAPLIGSLYILLAAVYSLPILYLYRYSAAIAGFLDRPNATDMESALANQKSFWKFTGIMAIIGIGLMLLSLVAAILIPLLARMRM